MIRVAAGGGEGRVRKGRAIVSRGEEGEGAKKEEKVLESAKLNEKKSKSFN